MAHAPPDTGSVRALFFGRFQPFHMGHYRVALWALERFDTLLILIGMADESYTPQNPFTADERARMVELALDEAGVDMARVAVATIPTLPVGRASAFLVKHYTPSFDVVVTGNPAIAKAFADAGFRVVKPPSFNRELYQGRRVRELMARGDPQWKRLVPSSVAAYIESIGGVERVRVIMQGR